VDFYAVHFVVGGEWVNYMRKLGGRYRNRFRLLQCTRARMAPFLNLSQLSEVQMQ
jgi:hypothetical protein